MRRRRRRRSSLMQPRRRSSPAEARLGIKLARGSGAGGTRGARATSMVAMGSQTRKHAVIYADATRLTLVAAGWGLFRKTKMVACKDNQGDHIHLLLAVCCRSLFSGESFQSFRWGSASHLNGYITHPESAISSAPIPTKAVW
ncbi:uncharacterized protein [Triticum aestivum]|uniref:uncharacterized protein isoform X2 n=1 Tax=Triticum aestivum TaxID=4565 RepID=UPI001D01635A|nr:uncharacterized protein LOC123045042 isoform X2 [Triticum aestivum]XP_044323894.1 uncharacterized protein LOC123045042 isoform X2 [Triticum aestivum]